MENRAYLSTATPNRIEITMLFLRTLQELYYDRLMPTVIKSSANMVKAGNLIDHAIKNARLILEKVIQSQKCAIFQKRKKVKPKPCTSRTNLINLGGIPHTKTTQTINHIT